MIRKMGVLLLASVLAAPAVADPVFGLWQTTPDDNGNYGHINVKACDGTICGTLIASFAADGSQIESQNLGRNIVWDMEPKGDGKYAGGKIWSPDRDKTYKSKMKLVDNGDGLNVEGCIAFFCRDGGTWSRLN